MKQHSPVEQDDRKTWTQSVQSISPGAALDTAILLLGQQLDRKVTPDECVIIGPFPIYQRPDALNRTNELWGVWDITIRWY